MAKSLIYLCYGMPKSGSTLAFNLTRAVLEDAGISQDPLHAPEALATGVNYASVIRPEELEALTDAMAQRTEFPVAIKTHSGLWGCVERAMAKGWVTAQAMCRDPRDVALSMMDAAKSDSAWGRRNGELIKTPRDALPAVKAHFEKFEKWAAQDGVLTLTYDLVAFDTVTAAENIAAHLAIDADAERCAAAALTMPSQFNKGTAGRWRDEMSADDVAFFEREFAATYEKWDLAQPVPRQKKGLLSRLRKL